MRPRQKVQPPVPMIPARKNLFLVIQHLMQRMRNPILIPTVHTAGGPVCVMVLVKH